MHKLFCSINRNANPPKADVIKRLTLIKSLILLEEFDEVSSHLKKLNGMTDDAAVKEIGDDPPEADYSDAVGKIEKFITDRQKITVYEDPEIELCLNLIFNI